jgi:hypothetical protein
MRLPMPVPHHEHRQQPRRTHLNNFMLVPVRAMRERITRSLMPECPHAVERDRSNSLQDRAVQIATAWGTCHAIGRPEAISGEGTPSGIKRQRFQHDLAEGEGLYSNVLSQDFEGLRADSLRGGLNAPSGLTEGHAGEITSP